MKMKDINTCVMYWNKIKMIMKMKIKMIIIKTNKIKIIKIIINRIMIKNID